MKARSLLAVAPLLTAAWTLAQGPAPAPASTSPLTEENRCLQREDFGFVTATANGTDPWSSVRVYFRSARTLLRPTASKDFYWIELKPSGAGVYWAVLPKPDNCSRAVEVYFQAKAKDGRVIQTEIRSLPLKGGCHDKLSGPEAEASKNLVVGNTVRDQNDKGLRGFKEQGIVGRVTDDGTQFPYTANEGSSLPCWAPVGFVAAGAAGATGIVFTTIGDEPQSPSRP